MNIERLVEAFGRGLTQGLVGGGGASDAPHVEAAPAPIVVPVDAVREAVAEFLRPLIQADEEAPTAPQLDLFTHSIEQEDADPMAEAIRRRVQETRDAAEDARREEEDPSGTFRPDFPGGSPWVGPPLNY